MTILDSSTQFIANQLRYLLNIIKKKCYSTD